MGDYRRILVAYDFSVHARAALYAASDLARRLGAELHLVNVIQPPSFAYGYGAYGGALAPPPVDMAELHEAVMKSLGEVAGGIEDAGRVEPHVVESGAIAAGICRKAEELGADLVVMGTHGRTGLAHAFLGSVAERTLRHAPCPVLTIRASEEEADSD